MRLSRYFLPLVSSTSLNIQGIPHQLLLHSGLVHNTFDDYYSWLPLGLRVLEKIKRLIQGELNRIESHQIKLPHIHSAPINLTNKEIVGAVSAAYIRSYQDLPLRLHQIEWHFKQEANDTFCRAIGQERLVFNGYAFDLSVQAAEKSYQSMLCAYLRSFHRIGLSVIPAHVGTNVDHPLNHRFYVLADTGQSKVFYDKAYPDASPQDWTESIKLYASDAQHHSSKTCPISEDQLMVSNGILVGHMIYAGTCSQKETNVQLTNKEGHPFYPEMGLYTLDITGLLAAIIEASHDDKGIVWPDVIAPFQTMIIDLIRSDNATSSMGDQLHTALQNAGVEVLYDDTEDQETAKFRLADLLGIPYQIIISKQSTLSGIVNVKHRKTGQVQEMTIDQVITKFAKDKL